MRSAGSFVGNMLRAYLHILLLIGQVSVLQSLWNAAYGSCRAIGCYMITWLMQYLPMQLSGLDVACMKASDGLQVMLVAVHPWDCHGAKQAGLQAAYIDRASVPFPGFFQPPDLICSSLLELANQLIGSR